MWWREIATSLSEEFRPQGYNFATEEFRYCTFRFFACFSKEAKALLHFWGRELQVDNSASKEFLDLEYRPCRQSLNEMVYSMIELGMIEDKRPKNRK